MMLDSVRHPILWLLGVVTTTAVIIALPHVPLPAFTLAATWIGVVVYMAHQIRARDDQIEALNNSLHSQPSQQRAVQRVVQLSTLNKVLSLLTETLSPDNVLDTVISSASAISDATAISVYLMQDGVLQLVRSAGMSDAFTAEPLLNPAKQTIDQPIVIENVHLYNAAAHLRDLMTREGKAAWIELPLAVAGRGLGTISLYFDTPQMFNSEDIELLRTFANQAAQAIQNAHIYAGTYAALETRIEQLSALATIGREIIATMDLQTISNLILKHAMDATCATGGAIVLFNEKHDGLILCAQEGYPEGIFAQIETLNQGITGRVLQTASVTLVEDVLQETGYVPLLEATRSQLSVPVIWRGEVIGVITLESDQRAGFQPEEGHFVSQLANQMVIAVDNARLFQRVAEARDRMQAILDTMAEAIILIDRWGQIALANPRVDLIGLNSSELLGGQITELVRQSQIQLVERMGFRDETDLRAILRESSAPESVPYALEGNGKMIYILRQHIPVRDEGGTLIGVLLVFQDETEQRELERARESFSNMIVHDLRSPLTAVTSGLSFLTEVIPPDSEFAGLVNKTANTSQRAIRKMLNRVNSLLDIARMQSGQLTLSAEAAELGNVVDAVFTELNPLANDLKVTLTLQLVEQFPLLLIDPEKIERVLLNLVDNALKFSPRGSSIIVRTNNVVDGYARIEVIDSGPGVPEAMRRHIFDSFAQVREQRSVRRGSGLGLSFCKLAIEAHGGRIWVEDNPGGGSVFIFTLPLAKAKEDRAGV